jgi:hypothetical protein
VNLGGSYAVGHVPIDELSTLPWGDWDADLVVVCVECPTNMYRGGNHVVRSAANLWFKRIKENYPRRTLIVAPNGKKFIDPSEWRKYVLAGCKGDDWKASALARAKLILPHLTDHNQAEAACIMLYAESMYRLLRIAKQRKDKK